MTIILKNTDKNVHFSAIKTRKMIEQSRETQLYQAAHFWKLFESMGQGSFPPHKDIGVGRKNRKNKTKQNIKQL